MIGVTHQGAFGNFRTYLALLADRCVSEERVERIRIAPAEVTDEDEGVERCVRCGAVLTDEARCEACGRPS